MKICRIISLIALFTGGLFFSNAQNTIGTTYNSALKQEGYTLFEYMGDTSIYLVDACGQVVHQWESNFLAGASVYLQDDGSIIRAGRTPTTSFQVGGYGGVLEQFDWDGNILWQYYYSDSSHSFHHDIEVLPNGNILAIAFELKTYSEAIDAGRDSALIGENKLWPEVILELKPIGLDSAEVVWKWHMWDHLVQDFDATKNNFDVVDEHPELFDLNFINSNIADWAHANSIDYNEDLDQIVLSLNAFNELIIIDHSTTTLEAASSSGGDRGKGGDLLFRYGNPEAYRHGDSSNRVNFKQHDVQWIKNGLNDAGKIMFYNNGNGRPQGSYSSIDIINPVVDLNGNYILEADTTYAPDIPEWTYVAPNPTDFFSPMISGAQRLENGNTLICQGRDGRLFEIGTNDSIVWEYWCPISNSGILTQGIPPTGNRNVFRAVRYPSTFNGFLGQDLTPGLPIEIDPNITDCLTVGLPSEELYSGFMVYPNPVKHVLNISTSEDLSGSQIKIFDISGKLIDTYNFNNSIDLSHLENGVYVVHVGTTCVKVLKK